MQFVRAARDQKRREPDCSRLAAKGFSRVKLHFMSGDPLYEHLSFLAPLGLTTYVHMSSRRLDLLGKEQDFPKMFWS